MPKYRCFLLNADDKIFDKIVIEADEQTAAIAEAGGVLSKHPTAEGIEVWNGPYLVKRLKRLA